MNFTTVAKLAGGSNALSALGGPYGKLLEKSAPAFGKLLDKAADKLPGILDKIADKLDSVDTGNINFNNNGAASLRAALFAQQQWDSNHDGSLSKEEITAGVAHVNARLGAAGSSGLPGDVVKDLNAMKQFGDNLLKNFDGVAALDNRAGVSVADLKLLAFNDNKPNAISSNDWLSIRANTPIAV